MVADFLDIDQECKIDDKCCTTLVLIAAWVLRTRDQLKLVAAEFVLMNVDVMIFSNSHPWAMV